MKRTQHSMERRGFGLCWWADPGRLRVRNFFLCMMRKLQSHDSQSRTWISNLLSVLLQVQHVKPDGRAAADRRRAGRPVGDDQPRRFRTGWRERLPGMQHRGAGQVCESALQHSSNPSAAPGVALAAARTKVPGRQTKEQLGASATPGPPRGARMPTNGVHPAPGGKQMQTASRV